MTAGKGFGGRDAARQPGAGQLASRFGLVRVHARRSLRHSKSDRCAPWAFLPFRPGGALKIA
jgi:hypothetical protein